MYDLKNFHLLQQFSYSGEGWGLATNSHELFMSDGTSEIRVLDTETFREKRRIKVRDGSKPIDQLNELEFVEDCRRIRNRARAPHHGGKFHRRPCNGNHQVQK